jgi:hypothetical protein
VMRRSGLVMTHGTLSPDTLILTSLSLKSMRTDRARTSLLPFRIPAVWTWCFRHRGPNRRPWLAPGSNAAVQPRAGPYWSEAGLTWPWLLWNRA